MFICLLDAIDIDIVNIWFVRRSLNLNTDIGHGIKKAWKISIYILHAAIRIYSNRNFQ